MLKYDELQLEFHSKSPLLLEGFGKEAEGILEVRFQLELENIPSM